MEFAYSAISAYRPPPVKRQQTLPPTASSDGIPLMQSQSHTNSALSFQSHASNAGSDSTRAFAPPGPGTPAPDVEVTLTDSVLNMRGDGSTSLFQVCSVLRRRLHAVPAVHESLVEEEKNADDDTDPVTLLWRTFRKGYPLVQLYNSLEPETPLALGDGVRQDKIGKRATYKFIEACFNDLQLPKEESFIVTDLFSDNTTGFAKVLRVIKRVLDILVQRGLIEDIRTTVAEEDPHSSVKRTQRQHIIKELVATELTYVRHLEMLQAFKQLVEEKGVIQGDKVHDIFLNLNVLLDFQRRFLIRVEQTNSAAEEEQNWGRLFCLYTEAFKVYEPYIANQRKCEKLVTAEFPRLKEAGGSDELRSLAETPHSLYAFLMKPFQRLAKYPLLLEDLYKKGDLDELKKADLLRAKQGLAGILERTNKAVDREEKAEAVEELRTRVDDWKGHRVENFGELLLYGTFTVLKSDSIGLGRDAERRYHVYLFRTILLCCKDIDLSKPKNKISNRQLTDRRGKPKLQLKGRIFMQNVHRIDYSLKPGKDLPNAPAASRTQKDHPAWMLVIGTREEIFWTGDPTIHTFIIRFTSEETTKLWVNQLQMQRQAYQDPRITSQITSQTEFQYLRDQGTLENPYAQLGVDDEDDEAETLLGTRSSAASTLVGNGPYRSDHNQSHNGSSTSLRSRSGTGESGQTGPIVSRQGAPRFAPGSMLPGPPLSIRSRELDHGARSPLDPVGESYFSPSESSPYNSSRTSSSSTNYYNFARQQYAPGQHGYYEEGHGGMRYTAPAPARHRQPSGSSAAPNGYASADRPGPAPYRVAGGGLHGAQQLANQHRNRSASSPDIHNNGAGPAGRVLPGTGVNGAPPPLPDMPAHYQHGPHPALRSQTNSPGLPNGMIPPRGASPQTHRSTGRMQHLHDSGPMTHSGIPPPQMGLGGPLRRGDGMHAIQTSRSVTPATGPVRSEYFTPMAETPSTARGDWSAAPSSAEPSPTQVKVKVTCPAASQTLTLVVPLNIPYQSLKDRIDAKLQRSTNFSLSDRGPKDSQVKLKYLDEEDFVSIQSDEDVQTAFEAWREQAEGARAAGEPMGEIELFCHR